MRGQPTRHLSRNAPVAVVAAGVAVLLAGGSTLPDFDWSGHAPDRPIPTVDDVIRHVECEIWNAMQSADVRTPVLDQNYMASATLTLDVTNNQGISANLGFITGLRGPTATSTNNFTLS